jgi:hypothetical protein
VVGPSEETTKSSSSGSGDGEGSLYNLRSAVGNLALDSYGWQSDHDDSSPLPVVNVGDNLGTHGSSNSSLQKCFCPDSLDDQIEHLDEGSGVLSRTIRCESVDTTSLASQAVDSAPCTDESTSTEFMKSSDSFPLRNSVDEGNLPKDGSITSAHGGDVLQSFFGSG